MGVVQDHTATPARPELTFPDREADAVRMAYAEAGRILEYGSGGSTLLAAERPDARITSVESDPDWLEMMKRWFSANPPAGEVELRHADIGPTENWGYPKSDEAWRRYAEYPLAVWDRLDETGHPDVVLVDGRFRTGCVLATAFRTKRPLTLLFDDYGPRKHYHEVEGFVGQPEMIGRLAVFEIAPMAVPAERLTDVIRMMTQP